MAKPAKNNKCGVQLLYSPDGVTFPSFLEIKRVHKIEDNAIVTIKGRQCKDGLMHDFEWKSAPVVIATDIVPGTNSSRVHLKLTFTLTIKPTEEECEPLAKFVGPEAVTVTITNYPPAAPPEPSDPEDVDPIYFP